MQGTADDLVNFATYDAVRKEIIVKQRVVPMCGTVSRGNPLKDVADFRLLRLEAIRTGRALNKHQTEVDVTAGMLIVPGRKRGSPARPSVRCNTRPCWRRATSPP
jgi:hypothetical protein